MKLENKIILAVVVIAAMGIGAYVYVHQPIPPAVPAEKTPFSPPWVDLTDANGNKTGYAWIDENQKLHMHYFKDDEKK